MTNRAGDALTYDNENHLLAVVGTDWDHTQYQYDADGQRASKKVVSNGVTTTTYYVGNWFEVTEGVTTTYYYLGGQRVAMRRVPLQGEQKVTYLHSDHLGSTSAWSGSNSGSQTYYPFGLVRTTTGPQPTDFTFTGQRVDRSTAQNTAGTDGLLYYGARYYDSSLGRFVQPDTVVPDVSDPQNLNRYTYALNNPIKYIDPSGHDAGCAGKDASSCRGGSFRAQQWDLRKYASEQKLDQALQVDLKTYPKTNQYSLDRQEFGFMGCGMAAGACAKDPAHWQTLASQIEKAAGKSFGPQTGIQPHALADAYRKVFGESGVTEHNEWTLEGIMNALAHGKRVVVDLQVRKMDKNHTEPSTQHPNYSHFALILGIDTRGDGAVYLQNTVEGSAYWTVTLRQFYDAWTSPEMKADPPQGLDRKDLDPVTRWGAEIE